MKTPSIKALFPDVDPATFSLLNVLDHFYEGVMITDTEGKILYFNPAQARIDDLEPEYAVGKRVTDVYRVDEGVSPALQCLRTGKSIDNVACFYRTRLGKVVNSLHNVFPLFAGGRLIGAICFVRDYSTVEQNFESVSTTRTRTALQTFNGDPRDRKRRKLNNGTRFTFDDIIGTCPDFVQAVDSAKLSSDSPSPLMLFGETGTGKELFAQSIHNNSRRKTKQYVAVNCAAIPENLLEGILFGTSRGAFTGAIDKQGLFERANGGTLLLDEINSMPIGLQAKLLRVIQERKIRRIGSLNETEIALKIISSVNEEPHQAIARGALRPDLFYRLGVVFIRIPPLRDRGGDLEPLICHFLQKTNAILDKRVNAISAGVMDRFHRYEWPGNVRELEHVIEGALNLVGDLKIIESRHISPHIMKPPPESSGPEAAPETPPLRPGDDAPDKHRGRINIVFPASPEHHTAPAAGGKGLLERQAENEIQSIEAALAGTEGNAAGAARQLGMSPQLLHYKLKKYGIDRKRFKKRG
jgi:arginine utilization regulatory protein